MKYGKETKTIPTKFNEKKTICKTQNFYLLLAFLLITIAKQKQAKQKHLLPFHDLSNKFKEVLYKSKMSNKVKDIDIKNHTYNFFDEIINIKNFDPINIRIDEKSYKDILIYFVGYATIKDSKYVKINSLNPLYFIFIKVNGYFEEINKSKYIMLVLTNDSKEKIKKYE